MHYLLKHVPTSAHKVQTDKFQLLPVNV